MRGTTKGILAYLVIAFAGAWIIWGIAWLLKVPATSPGFQLAVLPGGFAPALAAVIVRRWITHEGFADAGLRLQLGKQWPFYIFALLLPLFVVGVIVALAVVFNVGQPDFSLQDSLGKLYPGTRFPSIPPIAYAVLPIELMIDSLLFTPVLWGEEFGWRGYLQIRLFGDRPLLAAMTTGLIWGVWHYPLILMGYERYENISFGLLVFPVSTILLSIIFGWLRRKTNSVWTTSLAHSATNVVGASLILLLFVGNPHYTLVSYLGILAWIPLGIVCAWIIFSGQLWSDTSRENKRELHTI
jgi:membrane protease YdiL (CAAX protease family)